MTNLSEYISQSVAPLVDESILSSSGAGKTAIDAIYRKYGLNPKNITFEPDGSINYNGNVNLADKGLKKFPFKFNRVETDFFCASNELTTLEGAPKYVGGTFSCSYNNLKDLKGGPQEVGKNYFCKANDLTSLEGSPKRVNGSFFCEHNLLTSLKGCPEYVGGNLVCAFNLMRSFKDAPKVLKGQLIANY